MMYPQQPRAERGRHAGDAVEDLVVREGDAGMPVCPQLSGKARCGRVNKRQLGNDLLLVEPCAHGAAVLRVGHLSVCGSRVGAPLVDRVQPVVDAEAEQDRRERVRGSVVDADPLPAHRRQFIDDVPLLVEHVVDRVLGDHHAPSIIRRRQSPTYLARSASM